MSKNKKPSGIKKVLSSTAVKLINFLLYLLKNREHFDLSREEVRSFRMSFSQFGEDVIIDEFFKRTGVPKGTYIDIGAYDPVQFSNTLLLHKKGWQGINIDINPRKIERFNAHRPEDTNIVAAIGKPGETYCLQYEGSPKERLVLLENATDANDDTIVRTQTVEECLRATSYNYDSIDYVNIDCEGNDLEVLKQINLATMKPLLISIEALGQQEVDEIRSYLEQRNYVLSNKMHWTLIFVQSDVKSHTPTLK